MPCPIGFWCYGGITDKEACEAIEAQPGNYCPGAGYEPAGVECPVGYYCEVTRFSFSLSLSFSVSLLFCLSFPTYLPPSLPPSIVQIFTSKQKATHTTTLRLRACVRMQMCLNV